MPWNRFLFIFKNIFIIVSSWNYGLFLKFYDDVILNIPFGGCHKNKPPSNYGRRTKFTTSK